MRDSLQLRLARSLLSFGIRITPQHAAQWGRAMLGELGEVQGEWAALLWAIGGASVLTKHALVALVFPSKDAPGFLPNCGLLAKEGPMWKASLGVIGVCVGAFLLFLLAPTFRQGLGVSLTQWRAMSQVHDWPPPVDPAIKALKRQAEAKHDAQALAFIAARTLDSTESARLADEAVQLDPKLTWIYAVANSTPEASERWIQKLEQWDPQNALPYFMEAENVDIAQVESNKVPYTGDEKSPAWKKAMAAAFQSSKLDDYEGRLRELDNEVVGRYGFSDPYEVMLGAHGCCMPSYAASDAYGYAASVVKSGKAFEARGDKRGALEEYWSVIKFGEVTKSARMLLMYRVLKDAYDGTARLSRETGDQHQAEYFAFLSRNIMQERDAQIAEWRRGAASDSLTEWNADVVKVTGLLVPICSAILLICMMTIVAKSRTFRLRSLRAGRGIIALGFGSAVGLLISSALLYVSYWPYAEMFRQFLRTENGDLQRELIAFLYDAQVPLGGPHYGNQAAYVFYFWLTVIVFGAVALLAVAARQVHFRPRADRPREA